jgi:hypothetical protein
MKKPLNERLQELAGIKPSIIKEERYIMFSDAYKALSKIYYNGEFYNIVEIITDNELSDELKVKLIKDTLEVQSHPDNEDFEDEDEMHDDPGDIRIDHDYYTEQNTIAAASSGASVTTGDGMGYMSSNTFGKKRKKVNEQDPKMSDDQLAQWRKDNIDKPEEVPETKYSKDVEFILKYISKIDNKTEWGELMKVLVDLPIKDIKPTGKGIIIRNLLNSL